MTTELITRVRRRLADGEADIDELVRAENGGIVDDSVLADLRREVAADLIGAGPLEPLLALPDVTDVLVNGPDSVWLDRGAGVEPAGVRFADDAAIRRLAARLVAAGGQRLDDAMPYADVTLADGTRLHVVLPPLVEHPTLSLRVLARRQFDLDRLRVAGMFPAEIGELFAAVVAARLAVLVSGGTGTGKTTLLGALLEGAAPGERLVLVEECRELVVRHRHTVRLATRSANVEGGGGVGVRELVRLALRMRPDRIVVGEFRGAETIELLVALNTGHEGGAATVHANSAVDIPARLVALGAIAGVTPVAISALAASGFDLVVHLRRVAGQRMVDEVALLSGAGDGVSIVPVWSAVGGVTSAAATLAASLAARGVAVPAVLRC